MAITIAIPITIALAAITIAIAITMPIAIAMAIYIAIVIAINIQEIAPAIEKCTSHKKKVVGNHICEPYGNHRKISSHGYC